MKVAVIADIHANYRALQAVVADIDAWKPDRVVVAGDTVNRGPRPAECLQLILERQASQGWLSVRGNHEDYVISRAAPGAAAAGPEAEVHRASTWTLERLGGDVSALLSMPFQHSLVDPQGNELRVVHASMCGNRDGIYPETRDSELDRLLRPGKDHGKRSDDRSQLKAFCAGHTHRPLIRSLNGILVVNAGSSGLPFDGDWRASYARLTFANGKWRAEIPRLTYDIQEAEKDFYTTSYLPDAGPLIDLVLIELREACSMLYGWAVRYQQAASRGEITMEDSVRRYLKLLHRPRQS
jgi:predicted phosphodiesterase